MKQLPEHSLDIMRTRTETEAAFKVSLLVRREIGLPPCEAEAELRDGVLAIRLRRALTPMARLIARTENGGQVVQGAYEVLLDACRERLHALVTRIVGLCVRRSRIKVDATAEDVFIWFELCRDLPRPPLRRESNA